MKTEINKTSKGYIFANMLLNGSVKLYVSHKFLVDGKIRTNDYAEETADILSKYGFKRNIDFRISSDSRGSYIYTGDTKTQKKNESSKHNNSGN